MSTRLRIRPEDVHAHHADRNATSDRRSPGSHRDGAECEQDRDPSGLGRAANECIAQLRQDLALVEAIADEDYTCGDEDDRSQSSPGAHTRHLLDFVDCLVSGVDSRRIDYTARKRRTQIECSRDHGARAIERAIESIEALRSLDGRLPLDVRPEPGQSWTRSTLARELQFVSAHAVHHHALIRITLVRRGIEAPAEYGVAPSTLDHRSGGEAREERG